MSKELLVAVAELGDLLHQGDIVRPDHPLAVAQPTLFAPYRPPAPLMADGSPIGAKTAVAVARESFAVGDVVVQVGELHDAKEPIVRRAPANFVPFNAPEFIIRGD